MVTIDERRIAYFGPYGGGIVSLDDISQISIRAASGRSKPHWMLEWSSADPPLIIPAGAEGADGLIDSFAALPGFAPLRAIAALNASGGAARGSVTIWRRDGAITRPALAPVETRH